MTDARTAARKAAFEATWRTNDPQLAADAASDVWEPLVRRLRDGLQFRSDHAMDDDGWAETWALIAEATEALGDG